MFTNILQPTHLILIIVILLIVVGPGKLTESGKAFGKAIREFKQSSAPDSTDERPSVKNAETESK